MADIKALLEVGEVMTRLRAPWFVAGGWAIYCFLGRITREHRDVDDLVFRRHQPVLHSTRAEFPLRRIIPHPEGLMNRGTPAEWSVGEQLELPLHQTNVYRTADHYLAPQTQRPRTWSIDGGSRSCWARPTTLIGYRRNPGDSASASSDRFSSTRRIASSRAGGQFCSSKHMLAHDCADFDRAATATDSESRQWLRQALRLTAPDREWLRTL